MRSYSSGCDTGEGANATLQAFVVLTPHPPLRLPAARLSAHNRPGHPKASGGAIQLAVQQLQGAQGRLDQLGALLLRQRGAEIGILERAENLRTSQLPGVQ
jgi:hypothetical protein